MKFQENDFLSLWGKVKAGDIEQLTIVLDIKTSLFYAVFVPGKWWLIKTI